MQFRKYEKIHRLGKEETDGILSGTIYVEEKIDGANLSCWLGSNGELRVGSRNNDLTSNGNEFNGAVHYCNAHSGIRSFFVTHPHLRLYGEWLVKHTINYNALAYKKFYVFDIWDEQNSCFLPTLTVHSLAQEFGIDHVPLLATIENPTVEQLKKFITKSAYGEFQEGIVIKNHDFINQFGDKCYAKIVQEAFLEDNGVAFGGNNKFSESYEEQYISNKYVTLERVRKIMNKIQPEINTRLDMKDIPRVLSTVYHDVIAEEGWEITQRKTKVDFATLERICKKKARQIFVDILNDTISVADL